MSIEAVKDFISSLYNDCKIALENSDTSKNVREARIQSIALRALGLFAFASAASLAIGSVFSNPFGLLAAAAIVVIAYDTLVAANNLSKNVNQPHLINPSTDALHANLLKGTLATGPFQSFVQSLSQ